MERVSSPPVLSDFKLHEIAERSGISVGYLSLIFSGKRKNVRLSVLTRLGFALNLSVEEIKQWIPVSPEKDQLAEQVGMGKIQRGTRKGIPKAKDNGLQDLILRTIKSLEEFDPLHLNELKSEAEKLSLELPLKYKLIDWIEGILAAQNNQFSQALNHLMRARSFKPTKIQEKRMLAKIYGGMGSCYTALGDHKMAFKMFTKSLNIWGNGAEAALVYLNMGTLYRRCRQYRYSRQSYLQAIEMGSDFIRIMAYSGLGQICIDQNDLGSARTFLLRGYQLTRQQPEMWGVPELYCNLGIVYKLSLRYNKARFILYKGRLLAERLGTVRIKYYILLELEEVLLLLLQRDEANSVFSQLEKELSAEGDLLLLGKILLSSAQKLWDSSWELALDCLLRSYRTLGQIGPSAEWLRCCQLLADYFSNKGTPQMSDFYQDEVKRIKKMLNDKAV